MKLLVAPMLTLHVPVATTVGQEILELSHYCHARGIELVPNQNSFGHFHKFLMHDQYRLLAECPDGIDIGERPSGARDAPFSLCPVDHRSIRLINSLYSELIPHFPHTQVIHVGLDETADIGRGRSKYVLMCRNVAVAVLKRCRNIAITLRWVQCG